jgi:hypothetical protein
MPDCAMDTEVRYTLTGPARRLASATALGLVIAAAACAINLSPQSLVDKFRVVALKASPASGVPGQEVQLDVLMSDTVNGGAPLVLWSACIPLPGQNGRQCLESLADTDALEERFVFLGLGLETTATFVLPELAPDQESTEVFIVLAACAGLFEIPDCECPGPTCEECMSGYDVFNFCDGDDELVFKSIKTYSDPDQGNQNPAIARIIVDGLTWEEDGVPDVPCDPGGDCSRVDIAVEPVPGSAEEYTAVRFGEETSFTEEPYVSWFASAGTMGKDRSWIDADTGLAEVKWTPPEDEAGTVKFYFVLYDGRGGVDFAERHATVVP